MKLIDTIATALVITGAINWGLVGLFNVDLVAMLFGMNFGEVSVVSAAVYALVGLAGIYRAFTFNAGRELSAAKI